MSSVFSSALVARLPSSMSMPRILIDTMDWLESNGFYLGLLLDDNTTPVSLYIDTKTEPDGGDGGTAVGFVSAIRLSEAVQHIPSVVDERMFLFVNTGFDGSSAGFWLDDDGKQWIVHHGSGSGSVWFGRMSDDPVDLLKFMAIGYEEPAFLENPADTPLELWLEGQGFDSLEGFVEEHVEYVFPDEYKDGMDEDKLRTELTTRILTDLQSGKALRDGTKLPTKPVAFQSYLSEVHGISTPATAKDALKFPIEASDSLTPKDPFAKWLIEIFN